MQMQQADVTPTFLGSAGDGQSPTVTAINQDAVRFLKALFLDVNVDGCIGICTKPSFAVEWFMPTEIGIQDAVAAAIRQGTDVYFHCTTHDPSRTELRGNNQSAVSLTCLWADIDVAEAGKDNGKKYPPRELAIECLRDLATPPSILVHSGNGLHAYWLLTAAVDASDHKGLTGAWQRYLQSKLVEPTTGESYVIDPTGDLARLLRMPGTLNSTGGRPVRIETLNADRRHNVDDLMKLAAEFAAPRQGQDRYIVGAITLDPAAEPPSTKFAELATKAKFMDTWEHRRSDLSDPSQSTYDMSLAALAVRASWPDQEIADLIIANRRHQNQDLKLRIDYYTQTIGKARDNHEQTQSEGASDDLIEQLNRKHAVIRADRTLVLTEQRDPITNGKTFILESRASLNEWYANQRYEGIPIAKAWFESPRRRQYDGLVFSPSGEVEGYFNLFRGFPIQPRPGDCSLFLNHIREVICGGNEDHYQYVLKWFAHLFQKPAELPGTALVLRGKQGTGKGTMTDYIAKLVGQHFLELVQMGQVTGRFNGHMKDALVVHANEAIWAGDKAAEGALKAMITDPQTAIEFKGRDIISVNNYKRLILSSNHDWVVPRDMDDRRFFVLDVSDRHKEDHDYFAAIHQQMKSGGLEALMSELRNVDITDYSPRAMPESTGAGFDMKLRTMDSIMQWLYEVLDNGVLRNVSQGGSREDTWMNDMPCMEVFGAYRHWCDANRVRYIKQESLLGRELNRVLPTIGKMRKNVNGDRIYYYTFSSLEDCRHDFEVACKEEPYIWTQEV